MYYAFIIRSEAADKIYTGFTENLRSRINDHNSGKSSHTRKYRPWRLIAYFAFDDKSKALNFEKYLKTGSGIAFARRHII